MNGHLIYVSDTYYTHALLITSCNNFSVLKFGYDPPHEAKCIVLVVVILFVSFWCYNGINFLNFILSE